MAERRGLFGGFNPLRFNGQPNDKMMMLGAALSSMGNGGDPSSMVAVGNMITKRNAEATRKEAMGRLGGLFGAAGQNSQQPLDLEALSQGNLGPTDTEAAQQAPTTRGLPSLRSAAPALIQAMQAGVDVGDYVSILDKAKPNLTVGPDGTAFDSNDAGNTNRRFANRTNINGFVTDMNNPASEGRYLPQLGEGQRPLYDEQGNIAGVANLDGSVQAIAQRVRAENDARNASQASYAGVTAEATAAGQGRGSAPYALETIIGPGGNPITTSRQNILSSGPIVGQSAAGQAYAVDSAKNQAAQEDKREERASAAIRMLPTLDRMEALLPDIIAGVGSDWRQTGARVLGSLGNRDAAQSAAATEVFQNEARQVVAQIIGTFGANPTEGERKYAEQMAGADVNLTPQALQQGITLARARAYRDINGPAPASQGQGARRVGSRAEYDALPSGSTFIAPDGSTRRKP